LIEIALVKVHRRQGPRISFPVFGLSPSADGFAFLSREGPANDSFSTRSNCQMFATLRTIFSCVTIAPHENPN
jgi:hypothetical protein